ncbi:MAG: autotransporter domain-containing protein [Planctomycetaceae bacterium]|jgi:predicted outer membrane repeat protein|nr:autotransporter domain-containing protein [Planctomycetaceae bacterium]
MKKSSFRKNRSRRGVLAGLALAAVSALFPLAGSAQTINVGTGKDVQNLETVRNLFPARDGMDIVLYNNDTTLLGAFQPVFYSTGHPFTFRSADENEKIITYAGIPNNASQFLNMLASQGTAQLEDLTLTGFYNRADGGIAALGKSAVLNADGILFEKNGSDAFGGVVYVDRGTFQANASRFQNNRAAFGGGIYSAGGKTQLTSTEFVENSAMQRGGAVYQSGGTLNITDTLFRENTAAFGGAAAVAGTTAVLNNVSFFSNSAKSNGGAVYAAGNSTINIITDKGRTALWQGNQDSNGANSIFFDTAGDTAQRVNIYGEGILGMDGPLRAAKSYGGDAQLSIAKYGSGQWILGGNNVFDGNGLSTVIDIAGGTLELSEGTSFVIGQGLFTLADDAALISNGLNSIEIVKTRGGETAGTVFNAGSTVEFNMAGLSAEDGSAPMLKIQGGLKLPADGKFTVDVSSVNAYCGDGEYVLISAQDAGFNANNTAFLIKSSTAQTTANSRTGTRTLGFKDTDKDKVNDAVILTLTGVDKNRTLYWTGTKNQVWNETDANWENDDADRTVHQFLNGDNVVFGADTTDKNITLGEDAAVGTMSVAGDYTFTGKNIYGKQLVFTADGSATFDTRGLSLQTVVNSGATAGLIVVNGELLTITADGNSGAVLGQSGSVFTLGKKDSTGTVHFTGNYGGAINGSSIQLLGGTNEFSGNSTADNGGAIDASSLLIRSGNAKFENNTAEGKGGAVYVSGNAVLNADNGDILFRSNTQGADRTPNAIYLENTGGNKTLTLNATAGHSITFYDPVESNAARKNINVNITGAGTTKFIGGQSNVHGITTVNSGAVMQLSGGAIYGADTGNPEFIVKNGGTVLADGRDNQIKAADITLEKNSTLKIDLNGADNTGNTASLKLAGYLDLPGGEKFNIDATGLTQTGTYQLLTATDGTLFSDDIVQTKVNGAVLEPGVQNDRKGTQEFYFQTGAVYLKQTGTDSNRSLTWLGNNGGVWSENTSNWNVDGKNSNHFINGDTVLFDQNGQEKNITVDASGTVVAGMKVSGGDYTFTGGTISQINGDTARTLDKTGSGTLTLSNQKNVFDLVRVYTGTLAGGNGTLPIVAGDVAVSNTAAISPGSAGGSVAGTFTVDGGINFKVGSLLYLDLGKTAETSDLLYASDAINFASDAVGTVTIVVSGNGVSKGQHTTDTAVVRSETALQLNGQNISSGITDAGDNGKITIQRGSAKIVIESDASLDLQSANIFDGSKGLAIDAAGLGVVPPQPPFDTLTQNQRIVLESIQDARVGSFANSLMAGYVRTGEAYQYQYLEQLLPAIHSAIPLVSQRAASQFRQVSFERLRFLDDMRPCRYRGLLLQTDKEPAAASPTTRGQRFYADAAPILWGQQYGDFLHQGKKDIQGFQSDAYGIALGTDKWIEHHTVVGLGFGGTFASVKTADKTQWGNADSFLFSLYGSHTDSNAVKYMATIGYTYSNYKLNRTPGGIFVNSKHDGNQFFMAGDISKKFRGTLTDITPFLGLDLIYLDEDEANEALANGSIVSHINGGVSESYLSTAGVRFGRTRSNYFGWVINPSAYLGWIHDFGDGYIYKTALYDGGAVYSIKGASMNRDRAALGLNVNAKVNSQFSFFGGYNAEYGSRFSVHTIQTGFTFEF